MRKHILDGDDEVNGRPYQCPLLRLPEVYLSIAEAMNELGIANQPDEFGRTAYDYVNLVRGRVDMWSLTPQNTPAGEVLREAILIGGNIRIIWKNRCFAWPLIRIMNRVMKINR